ncbi:MAG: MBOAT family protein [Chitinophagales bacterium]|nr:MBOAT family protein [Chitinophagales bacterium]
MLFNSIDFAIFLPIVFLLYWFVFNKNLKLQNFFLLVVSYFFYGMWDWKFLSLIAISSFVDYWVGNQLVKVEEQGERKILLSISLIVNLGLLGFFKYFNFFIHSFNDVFTFLGHPIDVAPLHIILPVGISFYTFQTLSYSIDIYRKQMKPAEDVVSFFAYVSFFPQLVAGPIERAQNLLPQFYKNRKFDYYSSVLGLRQILWGLFKKVVVADNCATYVNQIFNNYSSQEPSTLLLGAILFAFQIYGDFSGYSDIAIGTARFFGFSLMQNFAFPYFSRDIAEFWRRWHISLSSWFKDYLYIPLGGSRGGMGKKIRNTFIIFLVSGFWHGANWTFVVWGALNAFYFLPLLIFNKNRSNIDIVASSSFLPTFKEGLQILLTFFLTIIAWIFFRADSVSIGMEYTTRLFSLKLFSMPSILPVKTLLFVGVLLLLEWLNRKSLFGLELRYFKLPSVLRWSLYLILIFLIAFFAGKQQEFIYFQF